MKQRVFAVAKSFGIDTEQFLAFCKQAGVDVKNSALAEITEDQLDLVLPIVFQHQLENRSTVFAKQAAPIFEELPTRRQQLYSRPCEKAHQEMIAGTCPWCGKGILPRD